MLAEFRGRLNTLSFILLNNDHDVKCNVHFIAPSLNNLESALMLYYEENNYFVHSI